MTRDSWLRQAVVLSAFSVVMSGIAGGLSVGVGLATSRLSLLGFGFDASVDAIASIVLLWRFRIEATHPARAEHAERLAERVVGAVLLIVAAYLGFTAAQA